MRFKIDDPDPGDVNDFTVDDALTTMFEQDDFPQDDWLNLEQLTADDLQYKDEVVTRLIDAMQDYLSFSTTRDLLKLIVDHIDVRS